MVAICAGVGIGLRPNNAVAEDAEIRAYGAYLASECVTCHTPPDIGRDNAVENTAIPQIYGLPSEAFKTAMVEYRSGTRSNSAMISAAQALDDQQIEALAAYFSTHQH